MLYWKRLFPAGVLLLSAVACSLPSWSSQAPSPVDSPTAIDSPEVVVVATPTTLPDELLAVVDAEEQLLINLYARTNGGVVNIDVATGTGDALSPYGSGSGFIIDADGHIVTNNHVVEEADIIWVTFSDGSDRQAQLLGRDPYSDLAVLQVDDLPPGATPLEWGDSTGLAVGQRVIAIGNPFGLEGTMTVGVVSAVGRSLPSSVTGGGGVYSNPEIIQTDAPINPGNSGGPLLDSRGRVVGINTAIRSAAGVNAGVGFAVPADTARHIVPYLIADGVYHYPRLGITHDNHFSVAQLATELDLPVSHGVLVESVEPGEAAARAGVRGGDQTVTVRGIPVRVGGDIIVAIDDYPLEDFDDLVAYLVRETEVGQSVVLTLIRDGEQQQITVELGERP